MEENLKALSVVEPWGAMIVNGSKSLEIRSWSPEQLSMLNVALVQNNMRLTKNGDEDANGRIVATTKRKFYDLTKVEEISVKRELSKHNKHLRF